VLAEVLHDDLHLLRDVVRMEAYPPLDLLEDGAALDDADLISVAVGRRSAVR
jgi:hypothetical protein